MPAPISRRATAGRGESGAARAARPGIAPTAPLPAALAAARVAKPVRRLFGAGAAGRHAGPGAGPGRAPRFDRSARSPAPRKGGWRWSKAARSPCSDPKSARRRVRLLARAGFEVVFVAGESCCGALVHHLGRRDESLDAARRNIDAWTRQIEDGGLDAIVITASGCGVAIKDYGFLLRNDPAYAARAERVSALARDVCELLAEIELPPMAAPRALRVAYHAACALQHGQKITGQPVALLKRAGFDVRTPLDAHLRVELIQLSC